jgi:hypothetical protein
MATAAIDLGSALERYSATFHEVLGPGHHVASPLGAWLLLALCGPAASGADRAALGEALGSDPDGAAVVAAEMLAAPHPLVAAAAAVWNKPGMADEGWLDGLPAAVERGGIPTQAQADDWARRHTFGLIDRFPLSVDDAVYILLATALATKVSWEFPFELAPGSALGESSQWAGELAQVLRSPARPGHSAFIATTAHAGDVAVHVGRARGGLLVASVIAGADVAPGDVLAAAHGLATAYAEGRRDGRRSLFDLPLGAAPLWSVREEASRSGDDERCTAVLPAWSARSEYDLSDPRLGFAAAAHALGKGDPWRARQAATASYSRFGFEAGAVTAMAVMMSALTPRHGVLRVAELRFGHPYAVVAVTADEDTGSRLHPTGHGPWHGVPVFSAWVADPRNAIG